MQYTIGVDEVGRGCLFGPVVSAAVAFVSDDIPEGLTDSKKLSPKKREELSQRLLNGPHKVAIAECSPKEIDEINILQASLLSMKKAVMALEIPLNKVKVIKVDGNFKIPNIEGSVVQEAIVKGDLKEESIAAASIVAKVYRDKLVAEMEEVYPGYGLSKHKGYPTKQHKEALLKLGVTDQHRKTFKGVSEAVSK